MAIIAENSSDHLGTRAVKEIMEKLGDEGSQGLITSLGKTLDGQRLNIPGGYAEACLARSEDAMKSFRVASFSHSSNAPVEQFITGNVDSLSIKSIREFHAMKCLNPNAMSSKQWADMKNIRKAVFEPEDGETMMEKMIQEGDWIDYRNYERDDIGSYIARRDGIEDLTTKGEIIEGLRLEPWFTQPGPLFRMDFMKTDAFDIQIPFAKVGNDVDGIISLDAADYPFTGTGWIATRDGSLRPEWVVKKGTLPGEKPLVQVSDGVEVWQISESVEPELIAIWDLTTGGWIDL